MANEKIVKQEWDYGKHAKFYEFRPNYAPRTIDMLVELARRARSENSANLGSALNVADIGAGTGNLTFMLAERGCNVVAVEPTDEMRAIGQERTKDLAQKGTFKQEQIEWVRATGTDSTLGSGDFDWVSFGSSFNVLPRDFALREAHRLLKKGAYFSAMWNHRDLEDPIQKAAEDAIISLVPNYTRGVRREDQRPIIAAHKELFDCIIYGEEDFYFHQSLENYLLAWQSVKNPYWDLDTEAGRELFSKICENMRKVLPSEFDIKYTTRVWSAKKI